MAVPKVHPDSMLTSRGTRLGSAQMKKCHHCSGDIMAGALACKHCGSSQKADSEKSDSNTEDSSQGAFAAALEESLRKSKKTRS